MHAYRRRQAMLVPVHSNIGEWPLTVHFRQTEESIRFG
jgi:hypothetical protein